MDQPRILLVDDEPDFIRLVDDILKKENFVVVCAEDGSQGLKMAAESHPDLVLLDWNLPGKDGLEVCKSLKADPKTRDIPVIMLTARGRETDVVLGLEMGAEDFISKRALRPRELVARIRAALRKQTVVKENGEILKAGDLALDTSRRKVTIDGTPVELRLKEFDLLLVFLTHRGRVLTRAFLDEAVWGAQFFGTSRAIDTTVTRLRGKLGKESHLLQSVKGVGYRFEEE
ncbi:MAG: response regulator transcription factor [Elusimicrobia bacterium]|nr:response regulator transcription factor [Elusimicrobiota bacterium]